MTFINRVDRHTLSLFEKSFGLMTSLSTKHPRGIAECLCIGGHHLKRKKYKKPEFKTDWELFSAQANFSHYKSFHHKVSSQCSC